MKNIAILGSTGSIGTTTLDVVERFNDNFAVTGLAAGSNLALLTGQIKKFKPKIVSIKTREESRKLEAHLIPPSPRIVYGQEGAEEVARFEENDIVVSAITGIEGLRPTLAAIRAGKRVALSNKESLVVAGGILQAEASASRAEIIPVDSEHSGIFQCLAKEKREDIKKVTLTASGGPFFRTPLEEMEKKTVEEALVHPRWKMGKKVTVDSATLMNKGLELIEARWLFGLRPEQLAILIHPQSIVHSLVEMRDGSTLAQLSPTDMRIPIQYALTFPLRADSSLPSLDLSEVKALEFYGVDEKRYPLIKYARQALEEEGSYPVALNAANEVAVGAFLNRQIGFTSIFGVISEVMEKHQPQDVDTLEAVLALDQEIRAQAKNFINQRF